MWFHAGAVGSKWKISLVLAWFRADLGMSLGRRGDCHMPTLWPDELSGQNTRMACEWSWVRAHVTFGGSVWVVARSASRKGTASLVVAWFRADSGTNSIKQRGIVKSYCMAL